MEKRIVAAKGNHGAKGRDSITCSAVKAPYGTDMGRRGQNVSVMVPSSESTNRMKETSCTADLGHLTLRLMLLDSSLSFLRLVFCGVVFHTPKVVQF